MNYPFALYLVFNAKEFQTEVLAEYIKKDSYRYVLKSLTLIVYISPYETNHLQNKVRIWPQT